MFLLSYLISMWKHIGDNPRLVMDLLNRLKSNVNFHALYLFWIMHPTTSLGALSKRDILSLLLLFLPRFIQGIFIQGNDDKINALIDLEFLSVLS